MRTNSRMRQIPPREEEGGRTIQGNKTLGSTNMLIILVTGIAPWTYACMPAKLLQLCLTPGNPMDCSPPGSSVHGILQARTLEWVAISFSNAGK